MSQANKKEAKVMEAEAAGRSAPQPNHDEQIALAAYYRAEKRGFQPGYEEEDWLAAEREIKASLAL